MANDFRVDVRGDMKRAIADITALKEAAVGRATYRSLNRALDAAATGASREIRREYNIKHRAVLSAMKKRRASGGSLFARLTIEGARIGLIEFDARWSRRQPGASVKVKVAGARKIVRGAFIATNTATGYRGVFRRTGKSRYPIRNLRSLSIPQAFSTKAVFTAVELLTRETFLRNYEQQVRFLSRG